jgi:hypothetical protein
MKPAAIGVKVHSGWGILVAVSGSLNSVEIVERRRIVITDPAIPRANQPYHHAATLGLPEAERHLVRCATVSERLSSAAISETIEALAKRAYRVVGAAVLLASGRPPPSLPEVLGAHPLIHTAEGEFFRSAIEKGFDHLKLPVTGIRERDLGRLAETALGDAAGQLPNAIARLRRSLGPPWTKDHKLAALAAAILLNDQFAAHRAYNWLEKHRIRLPPLQKFGSNRT